MKKKEPISDSFPKFSKPKRALSIREAYLSPYETISVDESCGRVASVSAVGCPPAVPIIMGGEVIDETAISCFRYYGINKINVVK